MLGNGSDGRVVGWSRQHFEILDFIKTDRFFCIKEPIHAFSSMKFFTYFFVVYQLRWMFFLSFLLAQKIRKRAPLADIQPTQGYSSDEHLFVGSVGIYKFLNFFKIDRFFRAKELIPRTWRESSDFYRATRDC